MVKVGDSEITLRAANGDERLRCRAVLNGAALAGVRLARALIRFDLAGRSSLSPVRVAGLERGELEPSFFVELRLWSALEIELVAGLRKRAEVTS